MTLSSVGGIVVDWTEERIETLRRLSLEGCTALTLTNPLPRGPRGEGISLAAFFRLDAVGMSRRCIPASTRPNGRPLLGERVGVRANPFLTHMMSRGQCQNAPK